jgi:hypothetical protein
MGAITRRLAGKGIAPMGRSYKSMVRSSFHSFRR